MSARALVTGHRGFTGKYVVDELRASGFDVLTLTSDPYDETSAVIDLLDSDAVRGAIREVRPEVVIHLAAIAFVAHGSAEEMYRVNIVGTRNLLDALVGLARIPKSILLASSANVYGNVSVEVIDESVHPQPANDYAVSKLAMEFMARTWMERLPITIARPFNYTGVGQGEQFLLPKIVSHFKRGAEVIELGNINVARDFQDVRSVAAAYIRLVQAVTAGETVNLCSGRSVSLSEVISMMEVIAGRTIEVQVNPAFVRGNEVARLTGSNAKLSHLVGPIELIPLEQTLEWMFNA